MLQLKNICKSYTTADFTQNALDGVSVAFRDNEFVAILGPSGSGKTTLLNIVGGLDHYDSGDLIIDGVSTKEYKDRDWDEYRNNRVGFVFQSYNLIPHQTVLANVELALTLSGVGRAERHERAIAALERVGLGEHINKKPSQLSGGQMQRVAIARALINDPEILLADEPTGALDSKTSVQIMDLLTEIAKDRLVVMVTHNPDLAEQYATRTVNLTDGRITSDSDPFDPTTVPLRGAKKTRRTHMSFLTALSLSGKNLLTKKGRTFMTSFAGSIGIIGIAAILALANGVNDYIEDIEEETLSEYPLTVTSQTFDMTSLITSVMGTSSENGTTEEDVDNGDSDESESAIAEVTEGVVKEMKIMSSMFGSITNNDLESLKEYLDSGESGIEEYVSAIEYLYDITPQIFITDDSGDSEEIRQVNPDSSLSSLGIGSTSSSSSLISSMMISTDIFYQLPSATNLYEDQYELVAGEWPDSYNEVVVVLNSGGTITDFMLYSMGLRDYDELEDMVAEFAENEEVEVSDDYLELTYDDILGVTFTLVNACDMYAYDSEYEVWVDKSDDDDYIAELVENGETIYIVGIVQPDESARISSLTTGIYYTSDMVDYIIEQASESEIVQAQLADPDTNVLTGTAFTDEDTSFDMESMFTIDTDAISAAFSIDTDAMTDGLSDLSIDLSDVSIDMSSIGSFDASSLSIDASSVDLSSISFDLSGLDISFDGVEPTVDSSVLSEAMATVMEGFPTWYAQNYSSYSSYEEALNAYMSSSTVAEVLADAIADAIDMSSLESAVEEQVTEQLGSAVATQLVPQIASALAESISSQLATAMQSYMEEAMTAAMEEMADAITEQLSEAMEDYMSTLVSNMSTAMSIDEDAFAEAFSMNMDDDEMTELIMSLLTGSDTSYESNLAAFGYADYASPYEIDIYAIDFESKEEVTAILDAYNDALEEAGEEDKVVTYTDLVGSMMSSVTTIINMISFVLMAFVAISLVVSSIMIGIITYISVLERKKEIGILRAIGASKGNIANVFNAETIIVGLLAGLIGVGVTLLASMIVNPIVYGLYDVPQVMQLPAAPAIALVAISVILTFVAGLIPSSAASRKDPVEALRSE